MFYVDTILLIIIAMGLLIGLVMLATVSLHLARTCHILDRVTKASEGSTDATSKDMYVRTYK